MAILNLLYLQFTFDSKEFKGVLSTIYNPKILTPYMHTYVLEIGTCKSENINFQYYIQPCTYVLKITVHLSGSTVSSVQEHEIDFPRQNAY